MKITFCASDFPNRVGGPYSWLPRLMHDLRDREIECRVLFFTKGNIQQCQAIQQVKQGGFKHAVRIFDRYTEQRANWVLEQLRQDPPDIFVPNLIVSAFYAGRWLKQAGIPTVGVMHSDDPFYYGILDEFVFGNPEYQLSGFVCVSRFLEATIKTQGSTQTTIRCIPYGAPLPSSIAQPPTNTLRIAYLGRLTEQQKQISKLTEAFCRVVKEVPNTEALIYGSGADSPAVEAIIAEKGKNLPIQLAGRLDSDQVQKHLLNCHVIVLLSDYEGLPIALMEAMACGLVPVCLRIRSGIPELIDDGVTGLLVDDRGDDFVNAIRRLREDLGLWQRLSQAARGKIEAEYSSNVGADRWSAFLKDLHQDAQQPQEIQIPQRMALPRVHQALAHVDPRRPSLVDRVLARSRQISQRAIKKFVP